MKKQYFILALIALCACGNKKEQKYQAEPAITSEVAIVDKETSRWYHSIFWNNEANNLATKNRAVVTIDATDELYTEPLVLNACMREIETELADGEMVEVKFKPAIYYKLHGDSTYTTYKRRYTAKVNDNANLSTTWYAEYDKYGRQSVEHLYFYVTGDTIYSLNYPEVVGFTPEGLTFSFTDKDVASITANYRVFYDVYAVKHTYARSDYWAWACRLASEPQPLDIEDDGSYTLPSIDKLKMSADDRKSMDKLHGQAIEGWEEFTGESMGDAPYLFDFDSYVVKLQVTYNDGTEREYTHLATALYFEP